MTYDFTKLFDLNAALVTAENTVSNSLKFVPEQMRENAEILSAAGFELARNNVDAMTKFGKAVKAATRITA